MLDKFHNEKIEAAYSLGIGTDVSWDEAIANKGIDVFMYDHTIDRLPKSHAKFHYYKTDVTGTRKGPDVKGKLIANKRQFPTDIDHPSFEGWPDLYLGGFSEDKASAAGS